MKKIYSLIAIALLSATTLMAQPALPSGISPVKAQSVQNAPNIKTTGTLQPVKAARKAAPSINIGMRTAVEPKAEGLAANQKLAGVYTTDSYNQDPTLALGYNVVNADLTVLSYVDAALLQKYQGSKIVGMRFALSNPAEVHNVQIWKVQSSKADKWVTENIRIIDQEKESGWHTVMFSNPETLNLTGLDAIMIGFDYLQKKEDENATEAQHAAANPLSFVMEGSTLSYTYIYNGSTDVLAEFNEALYFGNLSVQLILENDNFLANDVQMLDMATVNKDWFKPGETMKYRYAINNFGTQTIGNVRIGVYVDGNLNSEIQAAGVDQTAQIFDTELVLPADLTIGQHTLTIWALYADDGRLTMNTGDDRLDMYFSVYKNSLPRQKNLMEQFTAQEGINCLEGEHNLKCFAETRDDLAWVAIHGDLSDGRNDQFTNSFGNSIMKEVGYPRFPSVAFNRTFVNDGMNNNIAIADVFTIEDTPEINNYFNNVVSYTNEKAPSFATVDIIGSYTGNRVSATISGTGAHFNNVSGGDDILKDYKLTVCLTEDNVVAKQILPNGAYEDNYIHNNVLRDVYTVDMDDDFELKWTDGKYALSYSTRLGSGWNGDNMNIVAFISPKVNSTNPNYQAQWVTNANCIAFKDLSIGTGISGVCNNGEPVVEVARYNAAGQVISAPQKGLNIIKMSNGETKKVIIK